MGALHGAIASLASQPKLEESEEEHLLEQYHSSRTIRKLVLECPAFACKLYENALKGKCAMWVQGHRYLIDTPLYFIFSNFVLLFFKACLYSLRHVFSSKVISALWETSDPAVRELIKEEMQPLVDNGVLKVAQEKETTKAGRKQ